uniref:Uncharacterized protein n=1 Tax=Magnetospirillum gryphiswaldense TaxID=55518 RepID=A4U3B7_9PROT|nr:hypothetical protein MGR_0230 [Magnetospirillum gryphiswaldense MSR-1]
MLSLVHAITYSSVMHVAEAMESIKNDHCVKVKDQRGSCMVQDRVIVHMFVKIRADAYTCTA